MATRDPQRLLAHAPPSDGRVDVFDEGPAIRVVGIGLEDLVRRLERGHHGPTRVVVHFTTLGDAGEEARSHDLSPREEAVVRCVAAGQSNRELAADLSLGLNTVKTHIRTAYHKMGVTTRAQAVLWAVRHGLGPED